MTHQNKSVDEIRDSFLHALHQVAPDIDVNMLKPETVFREEFEIDSLDFLRLILLLHDTLKIDIPEKDYSKLATLQSSVAYLNKKTNQS